MLRGGAFNNNQNNVRCAYRNNSNQDNRNNNWVFGCVPTAFNSACYRNGRTVPAFCVGYGLRSADEGRCSRFLAEPDGATSVRPGIYSRGLHPACRRSNAQAGADPPLA